MIPAILRALSLAVRRDLAGLESVKVNNFFLFVALLIYGAMVSGVKPASSYPFLLVLGFLLLFPLSSDPFDRIPPDRLALWPISSRQWFALRLASLALSPILWLAVAILLLASPALAAFFLALAVGIQGLIVLAGRMVRRSPAWHPRRLVPPLPGRLGNMVRNNLRELLSFLDPYLAGLLAAGGVAYRVSQSPADPAAFPILAILVALALSTYAQTLFGLDSPSGMVRYRLLPLRGWQILLAKDAAWLGVVFVLVLPLSAVSGMTFAFTASAIGHFPSIAPHRMQRRWRFTSGRLVFGVSQILLGATLAFASVERPAICLAAVGGWLLSLWYCGRRWETVSP